MASDSEPAMPAGIANSVESPTSPNDQVEQDDATMPVSNEDGNPSLSGSQVDGMIDNPDKEFSEAPETTEVAKIQGFALLGAVLNDPSWKIAMEITKTKGFKAQVSSNDRCKIVRDLISGKKQVDDDSIPFVLATWCMLGGGIPTLWENARTGHRGGEKRDPTDWGKQVLKELRQLQLGQTSELEHFKGYAKGIVMPRAYNSAEAQKELTMLDNIVNAQSKRRRPKPNTASPSANPVKNGASSSRQSTAAKRKKTAEQNEGDETSNKGGKSDGYDDSAMDDESIIGEFTTGLKGDGSDFECDKSLRDTAPDTQSEAASSKLADSASATVENGSTQNGGDRIDSSSTQALASASRKRLERISEEHEQKLEQLLDRHPECKRPRLHKEAGPSSLNVRASSVTVASSGDVGGDSLPPTSPPNHIQSITANASVGDLSLRAQLAELQQQVKDQGQQLAKKDQQITAAGEENERLKARD